MAATRSYLTFIDTVLRKAKVLLYFASSITDPNNAAVQAVRDAIVAILGTKNPSASLAISAAVTGTLGTGGYNTVEDKAVFVFGDTNGKRHSIHVPGPKTTLFLSDGQTVDPSAALSAALISAVQTNCRSQNGLGLTFLHGRRNMTKIQKA